MRIALINNGKAEGFGGGMAWMMLMQERLSPVLVEMR